MIYLANNSDMWYKIYECSDGVYASNNGKLWYINAYLDMFYLGEV